jgi:hypothetical protein
MLSIIEKGFSMPKINRRKQRGIDTSAQNSLLNLSASVFREQYRATRAESVLIAQYEFEERVRVGSTSLEDARGILTSPSKFAAILFKAETIYRNKEEQKIHARLSNLERNTHWVPTAGISLGAGMVTGLVFAFASPFITTWLQPTADQLFKREMVAAQSHVNPQSSPTNITNNFYVANNDDTRQPPPKREAETHKGQAKITCKNQTMSAYKASLLELLHQGNVVTLEMNGYRPNVEPTAQHRALVQK